MFVLLRPGADPAELIEELRALSIGCTVDGSGLWLTGALHRLDPATLRQRPEVMGLVPTASMLPLAERNGRSDQTVQVGSASFGGGHFGVIAGPCAVESAACIDECARLVAQCGGQVLRGGAFKPRTSPYHAQGLGAPGLALLRQAGDAHRLPVVAELLCPEDCERLGAQVDLIQIGARNMQNFPLLRAAGRMNRPVLLKRGFCATQDEWLLAAEYILSSGNSQVILCERGIRTFEPGQRFTLDLGTVAALKRRTHLPVIVDPSHAAGRAELVAPLAMAAVCAGADGLMLELHPDPAHAHCDGLQALDPAQFSALMQRLTALRMQLARLE